MWLRRSRIRSPWVTLSFAEKTQSTVVVAEGRDSSRLVNIFLMSDGELPRTSNRYQRFKAPYRCSLTNARELRFRALLTEGGTARVELMRAW